jgi:hypothetical protein
VNISTETITPEAVVSTTVNPNAPTPDPAAIALGISTLFPTNTDGVNPLVELRVPKSTTGNLVGFFTDPTLLADAISAYSNKAPAVYYTLNTPPSKLAAYPNKVTKGSATKDADIIKRLWLLIDCDPIRVDADGKPLKDQKVSTTDSEKDNALKTLQEVAAYLKELGWATPISADSGNGYHLLYNLGGMLNTQELTKTIEDVLKSLAKRFNNDFVRIDTGVFNSARVTKAYGSLAAKGIATADRPHRLSALRNAKGGKVPLTLSQLQKVGATVSVPSTTSNSSKATVTSGKKKIIINAQPQYGYASDTSESVTPEKMEEFLAFHKIDHKPKVRDEKNLRWMWPLIPCPFDESHKSGESAVFLYDTGRKGWKCFHTSSCSARGEGEAGWAKLLTHLFNTTGAKFIWHTNSPQAVSANTTTDDDMGGEFASDIKPELILWLWPNRIPIGKLTLFAGHPNAGKGMATMYVTARATTGKNWHDAKNTNDPMQVLLVSNEDAPADTLVPRLMAAGADRTKVIIHQIMKVKDGERSFSLDKDLPALRKMLEKYPAIKLIVIDPISNHLGGLKMNMEQELRAALSPLGELAKNFKVAVLIVAHFNKSVGAEVIQRIGGAMAMVGAVRIAWGFGEHDGSLKMVNIKGNIGPDVGGLEYEILGKDLIIENTTTNIGYLQWGDTSHETAQTVLSADPANKTNKTKQAMDFLIDHLKGGVVRPATDIIISAEAHGFKLGTLTIASQVLGMVKTKVGAGKDAKGFWQLPEPKSAHKHESEAGND